MDDDVKKSKDTEQPKSSYLTYTDINAGRIDSLESSFEDLEKLSNDLKKSFSKLEEKQKDFNYFMMWIAGVIVVAFFLAAIPIFLDYFNNNEERYEKFINKIEEIKKDFYTKEQIDNNISISIKEANSQLNDFKNCIWLNGLSECLK